MYTPNVNKKIHETLCDIRKNNNNSDVVVAFIQIDTDTELQHSQIQRLHS